MKLKIYFTIFTVFYIFPILIAQEYHPLLNNSSWSVQVFDNGSQMFSIVPAGEETVGTHTYKKFLESFTGNTYFMREDVATKKVYKIINGQDVLFFDFNLQVSDAITLSNGQNYTVTSITTINVNGGQRKQFHLTNQPPTFPFNEFWIEGVGNGQHPLLANYEYGTDPSFLLRCSFQNGENIFNRGWANNGAATSCESLLVKENVFSTSIVFSPNPF